MRAGDCAVLTVTLEGAYHWSRILRAAGFSTVNLEDYDGTSSESIKVGTVKRAKGLEVGHVFLPDLRDGPAARRPDESEESWRERSAMFLREQYVALTRARDALWLGYRADLS